jgi:hypothetical protein
VAWNDAEIVLVSLAAMLSPLTLMWSVLALVLSKRPVYVPVVVFLLLGDRSVALMKHAQEEVAARQPRVNFYALLVLAGLFALDATSTLLF